MSECPAAVNQSTSLIVTSAQRNHELRSVGPRTSAMNLYVKLELGRMAHCVIMETPSIHGVPRWYSPWKWMLTASFSRVLRTLITT